MGWLIHHILKHDLLGCQDVVIVAVDDGSTDGTLNVLLELKREVGTKLVVLNHPRNRGLFGALKTAFNEISKHVVEEDVILTMDADRTHDLSYIPIMIRACKGCDVVVASRYVERGAQFGVPWYRVFSSRVVNHLINVFFNLKVKDITSNFRCYRAGVLLKLLGHYGDQFIESNGFEGVAELLIKIHKFGFSICEIPFRLDYSHRRGKSKLKLVRTLGAYLRLIWRSINASCN